MQQSLTYKPSTLYFKVTFVGTTIIKSEKSYGIQVQNSTNIKDKATVKYATYLLKNRHIQNLE